MVVLDKIAFLKFLYFQNHKAVGAQISTILSRLKTWSLKNFRFSKISHLYNANLTSFKNENIPVLARCLVKIINKKHVRRLRKIHCLFEKMWEKVQNTKRILPKMFGNAIKLCSSGGAVFLKIFCCTRRYSHYFDRATTF